MQKTDHTVLITAANLQVAHTLPANVRRIKITSKTLTSFRVSFTAGEVELKRGYEIAGKEYLDTGWLHHSPTLIFLASPVPGNLLNLEITTGSALALSQNSEALEEHPA